MCPLHNSHSAKKIRVKKIGVKKISVKKIGVKKGWRETREIRKRGADQRMQPRVHQVAAREHLVRTE